MYIVKTLRSLEKILKSSPKEGKLKLEMGRMWKLRENIEDFELQNNFGVCNFLYG